MAFVKLFIFLASLTICCGQSWYTFLSCKYIQRTDCYTYGSYPECGSDGREYRNRCDFSKAHCDNKDLSVANYGPCTQTAATTTKPAVTTGSPSGSTNPVIPTSSYKPYVTAAPTKDPVLAGSEAVLDFFCLELSHISCGTDANPVCGSDNITYGNECEFEKAKCTHRSLTVTGFGACSP